MTDLDALPFDYPDAQGPTLSGARGRRCGRHEWIFALNAPEAMCRRCGVIRDPERARRGKSSRRLGSDQERRAERRFGWEKIGERGQMTDLRGKFAKVQQKATRRAAPALFRAVFAGLDATKDDRVALLLLSYVAQGKPTADYVVIRGEDWIALHGRDEPAGVAE